MEVHPFDTVFDAGQNVNATLDWSKSRRPNLAARRVNVDFPPWMVAGLDGRAAHLGITPQASL